MRLETTKPVDRTGNRYCGPLVIAALAGFSTAEAAAALRRATGRTHAVKSVSNTEVCCTLKALGYEMRRETVKRERRMIHCFGRSREKWIGPTFAEWLRSREDCTATHIVNVGGNHYVLVKGRKMVDTFTKGEWVFIRSAPHRRKRVTEVFRVARTEKQS